MLRELVRKIRAVFSSRRNLCSRLDKLEKEVEKLSRSQNCREENQATINITLLKILDILEKQNAKSFKS